MRERLGLSLERYEAGHITSQLNVISSALHSVRGVFDLMPLSGEEAAANVAAPLRQVPRALAQNRQTLDTAADARYIAARHQNIDRARQCAASTNPARHNV